MTVTTGAPLPDIALPANGGQTIALRDQIGKKLVLYFYPKDNTSGCTQQGQDFRDARAEFDAAGCRILGVSRNTARQHDNFIAKFDFNFDLLADVEGELCTHFDVLKEKSMYGRKYIGIERSTFLFDSKGTLVQEWRGVKIPGHVAEVLAAAQAVD
ncbi:MAG: peroxiredoxin [Oceanococcaceae bacterium]